MEVIHFVTKWSFQAPIEKVWAEITDVISYPDKWPTWRKTVLRGSESKVQLGSVIDCVGRGVLPFSVRFTSEITTFQHISLPRPGQYKTGLKTACKAHKDTI